jgi:hypothetical protein
MNKRTEDAVRRDAATLDVLAEDAAGAANATLDAVKK